MKKSIDDKIRSPDDGQDVTNFINLGSQIWKIFHEKSQYYDYKHKFTVDLCTRL